MPFGQVQTQQKPGNFVYASRKQEREKCRIFGTVKYLGQCASIRVVDLSEKGIGIELYEKFSVPLGTMITVVTPELGHLQGKVCWIENKRIGMLLDMNSNASAQVSSYFRFFHEPLKTTIKR